MSLLNCHECGKEVSTASVKYPGTGARANSEERDFKAVFEMGYPLLGIGLCLAIVFSTLYR